jgi:O-antigen/teichoic acid export membrane protein
VLNVLLIPRYGMVGAGIATVATEAVRLVIALVYVRTHGFQLRNLTLFGRVSLAGVAMTALLLVSRPAGLWIGLPLGAAAYLAALVSVGGVRLRRGELPMLKL